MTAAQPEIDHAPAEEVGPVRRKGLMDQVIETLASGLGNSVGWLAEHGVLFIVFAAIWVAFGAGLLLSQGSLDQAWQAIRDLPPVVQVVVWLLFLPVMIGLWVWETTWPLVIRLAVVLGIAGWNLLVFLPKAFQAARP
jgi:hypothetical protein